MRREQDTILFDDKEQTEFGVQPVVTVESALKTADVFGEIAHRLLTKIETPADEYDFEQQAEWRQAEFRAPRLLGMAGQIMMLCPVEVIAHIIKSTENS